MKLHYIDNCFKNKNTTNVFINNILDCIFDRHELSFNEIDTICRIILDRAWRFFIIADKPHKINKCIYKDNYSGYKMSYDTSYMMRFANAAGYIIYNSLKNKKNQIQIFNDFENKLINAAHERYNKDE